MKNNLIENADNIFHYNTNAAEPCIMVIFGGTGDLTHRKLMPALYNLKHENRLPERFAVVAVGRRDKDHETYRYEVYDSIKKYTRFKLHEQTWSELRRRIYYQKFDFHDDMGYARLDTFLQELDKQYRAGGSRIFYLAVAPEYFAVIVEKLHLRGMALENGSRRRLVIEKPFGRDLASARQLNRKITAVFDENNIYRIDHYLGKEMLQNIMVIRFANMLFEPVWNNRFIDNVQILSCEKVGVGSRGGYYEQAGALRDMLQNHMLQLLTLTAIEPPAGLDTKSIRDEKVKVLRSLEQFTQEQVARNVVRGQYGPGIVDDEEVPGYRQEERVSPTSDTETFIALKAYIDNFRWAGVPFYIRTGKRMPVKATEIIVRFKPLPKILYAGESNHLQPNILIIKIQPREGVFFQFNAKKPGTECNIVPVRMDYCQNCREGDNSPAAYERLLFDVMRGESTLFARWDEVEYAWKFVDNIAAAWDARPPGFPNYPAGTWGPPEAAGLLAGDNRSWLHTGDTRP